MPLYTGREQYDLGAGGYLKHYDASPLTTRAVAYYSRYLLQKAFSVFKWTVPDNWDLNYVLYHLYTDGFLCVSDVENYGIIPQIATIAELNVYYNPAVLLISNPAFQTSYRIRLGTDGEILSLTPDYAGIMDCVQEYAEMLANASAAVNTNLYNSRCAYVFYAKNAAQAKTYKKMYDQIGSGEPAVFIDSQIGKLDETGKPIESHYEPFNANLSQNYISDEILDDMRKIEHLFAQKIGLPNTNTEKKERMNVAETDKTDIESESNCVVWFDTIQESIRRIHKLYPDLKLACEWRYPREMPGERNTLNGPGGVSDEME